MMGRLGAIGALLLLTCVHPAAASAQAICGVDYTILPADGRIFNFTAVPMTSYWFMAGTNTYPGVMLRSYSIEVIGLNGAFGRSPDLYVRGNDNQCALANYGPPLRDTTNIEPRLSCDPCLQGNRRFSFTTPHEITNFIVRNPTPSDTLPFTISLAETTMFSPAWSTSGNYVTYWSFYNNTSKPVSGTLVLRTITGSIVQTSTVNIQPFTAATTNTVALGVAPNQTGTASLTHDAPPGALTVEADIANFTSTPAYVQPVKFEAPRQMR